VYLACAVLIAGLWFPCCGPIDEGVTPDAPCNQCANAEAACWSVTIAGVADDTCSECEQFNGTYLTGSAEVSGLGYCTWDWAMDDGPCGEDRIGVQVQVSTTRVSVILIQRLGFNVNTYEFRNTSLGTINCLTLTDQDIPYYGEVIGSSGISCDASSATATISAANCA
jgi:hypothetical protein